MESGKWREVSIDAITIGPRFRKDLGDIAALAESIEQIGLLHPIIVTTGYTLVAGRRRLAAHAQLGRPTIEARVIDLDNPWDAEVDENGQRKDYTISEWVAIGEAREERDKEHAEKRMAEGQKSGGRGKKKLSVKFTESLEEGEARKVTAKAVGLSWPTYQKAKAVVQAAADDPFLQPLVEQMDRTGKVTAAWNRLPEDLKSTSSTNHTPKAPPIFTRETIITRFDKLFHRCAPSFHTFDEEGVQQMQALFAYFLNYITTEAQQGVAESVPETSPPGEAARAGDVPTEPRTSVYDDDAPRANLKAVAARMNERLQQLPFTRVKAKKETAIR